MSLRDSNDETGDRAGASPAGLLQGFSFCGVLVIDSRKRIVACTPEAAKCLQIKPRRLLKATLDALPAPLAKCLRRATAARKPLSKRQVLVESDCGQTVLHVSTLPLPSRAGMVVLLGQSSTTPEAEQNLRAAMALKITRYGPDHWEVATTKNLLGACLSDAGKYKAAEPLLTASYAVIKKQFGPQHDRTRRAVSRLITLYEKSGKKEKAAALRAELGSTQ